MPQEISYEFGRFHFDPAGLLLWKGKEVPLPPKEAGVLLVLVEAWVRHPGDIVKKEDFYEEIWSDLNVNIDDCLKRAVFALRKALWEKDKTQYIKTYSTKGYRFVQDVRVALNNQPPPSKGLKLAVLPFRNLVGGRQPEYFIDGLTDDITTDLGRINPEQLRVTPTVTAMRYKNTKKRIKQVGKELAVQYVIVGTMFRSGGKFRVSVQLVQVADESQLWAERYERKLKDISVFLREICLDIAREIKIKLVPHEQARFDYVAPVEPKAYDNYLNGRYLWNKRTPRSLREAVSLLEKSIGLDPKIARAHSNLADCYAVMASQSLMSPKEACEKARESAMKALDIDPAFAEPYATLGFVHSVFERQWPQAEKEFQQAIRLNPNYPTAHHWYSFYFAALNRMKEAIEQVKKAQELDSNSRMIKTNVGTMLYWTGKYEAAIEQYSQVLAFEPEFWYAYWMRGMARDEEGQYREAAADHRRAVRNFPGQSPLLEASLARSLALAGNIEDARRQLKQAIKPSRYSEVSHYYIATAYAALGDKDAAFRSLSESCAAHEMWVSFMHVDPKMAPLRRDARYGRLRQALSL